MKKLFTLAVLILPALTIATPAENYETAPLSVYFAQVQDLNTLEDYQMYQKGRRGDSGFRSMNHEPTHYDNENLVNKLYKKTKDSPLFVYYQIKKVGLPAGESGVRRFSS